MKIIQAKESDIVEALFIIKSAFENKNLAQNYWRPPVPDYDKLKEELDHSFLYMIRKNHISIGILAFTKEKPNSYNKIKWKSESGNELLIKRIAIAPNWLSDELKSNVKNFIDNYARENNFKSVRLNVYTTNQEMNTFYKDLGFESRSSLKEDDFENLFNYYEKVIE